MIEQKLTESQYERFIDLIIADKTDEEITSEIDVSKGTIKNYRSKYAFLKKNWRFKNPQTSIGMVKKGETGVLRTPQRPDGIFR